MVLALGKPRVNTGGPIAVVHGRDENELCAAFTVIREKVKILMLPSSQQMKRRRSVVEPMTAAGQVVSL